MLSDNFIGFYNNWLQKFNDIQGQNLSSLFDRYITLFIIYNSLYTQVPLTLIQRGTPVKANMNDKELAIRSVIKILGAPQLIQELIRKGSNDDILRLINLIEGEQFYINLHYGTRQRNEDLLILNKLRSTNLSQKAVGILDIVYNVRCNLVHGHKDFVEPQRELLEPLIAILKNLNEILFDELTR
ncbi:hypothetical protein ACJVDH_19560 [Pedobacter sp. AW1-32]|uniref:hypothetical protein n=1 Tax=Pedobacter sp. AW1-32 TaxID=3383026 RepID=UPI003FF0A496